MPGGVPVVSAAVVVDAAAIPMAVPTAPAPAATAAAHHCANGDARSEADHAGGNDVSSCVSRSRIGRAVNDGRAISRYINDLRVRRLDDDGLLPVLRCGRNGLLRSALQVPGGLGLLTKMLNGSHYVSLLIVVGLAQLRRPRQVLCHVFQHTGKLR